MDVRPIDLISQDTIDLLVEKQRITATVRGTTPLDAPERAEIPVMYALIEDILDEYGVTLYALSLRCGLNRETLNFWMRRHGWGGHRPPSQPAYRNTVTDNSGPQTRRNVIGGTCMRGHLLTEENVYTNGLPGYGGAAYLRCRTCSKERDAERRQSLSNQQ